MRGDLLVQRYRGGSIEVHSGNGNARPLDALACHVTCGNGSSWKRSQSAAKARVAATALLSRTWDGKNPRLFLYLILFIVIIKGYNRRMREAHLFNWIQSRISLAARRRRGKFLTHLIDVPLDAKILDLGGGTGAHIHAIFPSHRDVTVCDISADDLARARKQYGYRTVQLTETERLPFDDGEFDFCFCSSVIEHVTGPKQDVFVMADDEEFRATARRHQLHLAAEIGRIAKAYYVQTPYRYFLIESHSCLPGLIVFLPRRLLIRVLATVGTFWFKKTLPDWYLLSRPEMEVTFPEARIFSERVLLMTKSLMAIKVAPMRSPA